MKIPERLIKFLDQQKARYEIIQHPQRFTAQELSDVEHIKGRKHLKVLMVRAGGKLVMAVLPSDRKLDLEKFETLAGAPAVLASEDEFKGLFPDCGVGTMPPFGHLYGVETWMDSGLAADDFVVFEAGTHTDAIKLAYRDFERLASARRGDIAF